MASSLTNAPGGPFSFNLIAPGAAQVTIYTSTNLMDWQFLQTMLVTNSVGSFMEATSGDGAHFYRFTVP